MKPCDAFSTVAPNCEYDMSHGPDIRIKRVYERSSESDGFRILVDRLWPRGLKKDEAEIDLWARDVAPSTELRRWFAHDPAKFQEFKTLYLAELGQNRSCLEPLLEAAQGRTITLVYGARDQHHNHAIVLQEMLIDLALPRRR